ncbi:hypothetical protein DV515_00015365 [Chloebia gouldiae]|uniref:Uncharacterized protein n=1 Tax=Chloebia gouldiae TaxID=44316 RepID=A0A3L8RVX7_CHLGU|nr:hypothetical protein DV515_00015365 [Chloebia gouldiae]
MLRSALRSFPGKAPLCSAPGSASGSLIFPGLSVVEGGVKRRLVLRLRERNSSASRSPGTNINGRGLSPRGEYLRQSSSNSATGTGCLTVFEPQQVEGCLGKHGFSPSRPAGWSPPRTQKPKTTGDSGKIKIKKAEKTNK